MLDYFNRIVNCRTFLIAGDLKTDVSVDIPCLCHSFYCHNHRCYTAFHVAAPRPYNKPLCVSAAKCGWNQLSGLHDIGVSCKHEEQTRLF